MGVTTNKSPATLLGKNYSIKISEDRQCLASTIAVYLFQIVIVKVTTYLYKDNNVKRMLVYKM
jgi:hypothetical protein